MRKQSPHKSALGAVFITVFIDMIGFGMIVPILPTYARDFDASPGMIGVLVASYSLAQLLFAPLVGRASDRWGRGPVIAATAAGAAIAYLTIGLAGTLVAVFAGRILAGACAASTAAAQGVVADVLPPERRAGGMAVVGAGIGLGIVLGPGVASLLVALGDERLPFFVAAALSIVNIAWALFALPRAGGTPREGMGWREVRALPGLLPLLAVSGLVMVGFSMIDSQFPLFTADRLGFGAVENGLLFMYVGVLIVLVQLTATRWLSNRVGEVTLMAAGALILALGAGLVPLAQDWWYVALPAALVAAGNATNAPTTMAAISRVTPQDRQGEVFGLSQSVGAGGRVLGPVLGGWLFQQFAPSAPYVAAALVLCLAAALAWAMRGPARSWWRVEQTTSPV
ncbi:putative MFS family arabinose efflux permease [Nocardiopsis sp. Huas11]|uniref:MFS transporter n=1 Tax=Nocardiopsis sp. Huas11 TaxID=2183912 RepID=UPI000EAF053D|nr:MFS transporter [Nocardiopsis sp. Huas11]RKS09568.1 putative MFS family arabinose efflux permease [Nocardiopsis sp. Huas11]